VHPAALNNQPFEEFVVCSPAGITGLNLNLRDGDDPGAKKPGLCPA
jgi:hypothetical protein